MLGGFHSVTFNAQSERAINALLKLELLWLRLLFPIILCHSISKLWCEMGAVSWQSWCQPSSVASDMAGGRQGVEPKKES